MTPMVTDNRGFLFRSVGKPCPSPFKLRKEHCITLRGNTSPLDSSKVSYLAQHVQTHGCSLWLWFLILRMFSGTKHDIGTTWKDICLKKGGSKAFKNTYISSVLRVLENRPYGICLCYFYFRAMGIWAKSLSQTSLWSISGGMRKRKGKGGSNERMFQWNKLVWRQDRN